jgi:6-phosphogluconolactonase
MIRFFCSACLILATLAVALPAQAQNSWFMYVGTYTRAASKGIYGYRYNSASGKATPIGLVAETSNPTFLAVHPNHRFLYAVNEDSKYQDEAAGSVSAFAIDGVTGQLKLLNRVSSKGTGPCHVSLDHTAKWLFVSNYAGGSLAAYPVHDDGSLGEAANFFQNAGSSANAQRQAGPHAHVAMVSPDNRRVLVADLGLDQILSYRLDRAKGLTPDTPPFTKVAPGSGPRHLVFSSDGRFVYLLNEIASNIIVFRYDAASGSLTELQTIKTLPDDFSGNNTTAEIELHPSGKFLYASNRGHNSIAIFSVDSTKGTLTALNRVSTQGKTPRNFAFDPSGSFLLAANQDTNNVVTFRADRATGALTPTGDTLDVPWPVSIVFAAATQPPPAAPSNPPDRAAEIRLWPNGAPGSEGITVAEVSRPSNTPKYQGLAANYTITHYPSVYVFLPPKDRATGAAVVVAPGGGHTQVVIEKEGWEIADWLNSQGIAAFVLKYRLARAPGSTYTIADHVYADAARSVRLVRSHAKEWNLDPARIGFMGFSAGGEIAGMIETKFDAGKSDAADPIERVSSRPDFDVLIYPAYRPGANPASPDAALFPVPTDAPPAFLVCADDDRSHVEATARFYLELEAKKIPSEMHIYASGGHGFALRQSPKPVSGWPERLKEWFAERGISK